MASRADLLDRLRFNLLQKNPDVCLRARAAAQLNPEGLAASIWDALDASEQAEERLLRARARGFQPGDWDKDARLCTCGRWLLSGRTCACLHEASAPWRSIGKDIAIERQRDITCWQPIEFKAAR